jgi:hypothetical protein
MLSGQLLLRHPPGTRNLGDTRAPLLIVLEHFASLAPFPFPDFFFLKARVFLLLGGYNKMSLHSINKDTAN